MRKLLWIDEDAGFTQMVQDYLGAWGFQLHPTEQPPAKVENILSYEGLVWDFTFNTPSDKDILLALRQHPQGSQLPVLLLFSRPFSLEERLFLNEHRLTHHPKWTTLWTLLQKIQEIVD